MSSTLHQAIKMKQKLQDTRRQLHQYPELSFQEYKTTKYIQHYLEQIDGMEVVTGTENIGLPTGVVGTISSGSGPNIAIRSDIDALPIYEENEHEYVSKNKGIMHACGHDAHTTIALGVASLLSEKMNAGEIKGTVKFIFQPAEEDMDEEGLTGSPYLINAGVLEGVDAILALHVNPEQPVGEIQLNEGYSMASIDTFDACIKGSGGHAAYPHLSTDPISMLPSVLENIQGIISRRTSPLEPAVISVTSIETVPSYNVIPSEVKLQGTIRSYNPERRNMLKKELQNTLELVKTLGGEYELTIHDGEPALNNHPTITKWFEQTTKDLLPDFHIHHGPFGLGGEDFSHMTEIVPGAVFFLGAKVDNQKDRGLHMPKFDINEDALPYGVTLLSETAIRYIKGLYTL
ncbi:amidohydrolase [Salirhabdus euzebyi]|uniref:Amidohydrolase n=1 Tax=Salirhabdus euzebyi TaxID=394506 RepID=A0A841Q531_9BACI|nr:amidohydrolase [Salirhabdus euzebyi]MBB6453498.1 amidohydrolase [Salirhabdus euzebyi]